MSGTSLDGVDAALVEFNASGDITIKATSFVEFPDELRTQLLDLNLPGANEIERSHLLSNRLSHLYAHAVGVLLQSTDLPVSAVSGIGCHGQTIRHRPDLGFTTQIGNPALLAELTGIPVIADFRSRDVAAGGHGAPLVPAFHQAIFRHTDTHRVIVNIGGISNLTNLPPVGAVIGFDCGPANILLNGWINRHLGLNYDTDGNWASSGVPIPDLLGSLLAHQFLSLQPPKSTGRDDFHIGWLDTFISPGFKPVDVQATLLEFAARCISDAISKHCAPATEIYLCGGGAHNLALVTKLRSLLPMQRIGLTDELGISVDWVEAVAFAWLARQTTLNLPGNLPNVTGAKGPRVLGAIYPA